MTIAKLNGITWSSVSKVDGVAVASISKINGMTKPAGVGTMYTQTLNADNASLNGNTFVILFSVAELTLPAGSITQMRVTFEAASASEGLIVTDAYVGHRAGAGDAYDFAATPVQLLFSGVANVSIGIGGTATSDLASFAYDKTSDLLVAYYVGGGTGQDSARERTSVSGVNRYVKAANDAATVDKTGYALTAGNLLGINKIETDGF